MRPCRVDRQERTQPVLPFVFLRDQRPAVHHPGIVRARSTRHPGHDSARDRDPGATFRAPKAVAAPGWRRCSRILLLGLTLELVEDQ